MPLQEGQSILNGEYRILGPIGEGGFGTVWRALEVKSQVEVAIKEARSGSEEAEQRFSREIKISRRTDHPNLLKADSVREEAGTLYLIMPFVQGGSLRQRLEGGPLPIPDAVRTAAAVADGLGYLHGKDLVHRDVHPGNILFTREGVVKLVDLGLVQSPDFSASLWSGEKEGRHPGNLYYIAPEAIAEPGQPLVPLYPAADVYMLGAVLWEMLTGRVYYNQKGRAPSTLRPEVPSWLDQLAMRFLAPQTADRPADGNEAARLLRAGQADGERESRQAGLYRQGQEAMGRRDWPAAIEPLAALVQEAPDYQDAAALLAQARAEQKKVDEKQRREEQHRQQEATARARKESVRETPQAAPRKALESLKRLRLPIWAWVVGGLLLAVAAGWGISRLITTLAPAPAVQPTTPPATTPLPQPTTPPATTPPPQPTTPPATTPPTTPPATRPSVAPQATPLTPTHTPSVSPATTSTPTPIIPAIRVTNSTGANLRAGPGTEYSIVGHLEQDAVVLVLAWVENGRGERWLLVQNPAGGEAWVSADLGAENAAVTGVAVAETVPPTPLPTISPTPGSSSACTRGQSWTRTADGMTMLCVPAGDFLMGSADSDAEADADEKPQHTVYLDAYWVDRTEVTNTQYRRCVDAGVCAKPGCWGNPDLADDNQPVVCVSWADAATYCGWAGATLPTEAQWEKAARGTDGRLYPWGNATPVCGQLLACGRGRPEVVGSYPAGASLYGAEDMAGNVWEWVADLYDRGYYAVSPAQNPTGPAGGSGRVVRGGAWHNESWWVRTASRAGYGSTARLDDFGFRCVVPGR